MAVSAAALMAPPFNAPVLFSDGTELPGPSASALKALDPKGADAAGKAQVIRVGKVAKPPGCQSSDLVGDDAFGLTRAIATLIRSARPGKTARVLIASADDPSYAAPAANYAAKSGDPVLFVTKDTVPPETRAALAALGGLSRARIYILGPSSVISPKVRKQLSRLGRVKRYGGADPVANALAAARFKDGAFGWGVVDPGHGLVFVARRPAAGRGRVVGAVGLGQVRPARPARRPEHRWRSRCSSTCSTSSPATTPTP